MSDYRAPIADMRFALNDVVGLTDIARLPGYEEATPDLVDAVLEEASKLAGEVIGPLNKVGDEQGSVLENGLVRTPEGFGDAYRKFIEGGWNSVPFSPEVGGQGLPWTLNTAVTEMWDAANTAWALCPMLTAGAVDALSHHATDELKERFLTKLVSGEWTGTMNLTEPQAGSDVGALRSKAVPENGHYRITGQKIFITYGDQDYTDNVCHLVLARIEGAPEGVKGISLFLVPKVMVEADGSLGQRNDLRVVSLEHKLGIHASPTCVMSFGENEGAIGYLIGRENDGMACMFTMMNNARLNVGLLGLGTAERAYQQARDFAAERIQGRDIATGENNVAIIRHPDVRRMLMTMKAQTEAMRMLAYYAAAQMDISRRHPEEGPRQTAQGFLDLLIPVVKSWCTDTGVEVANTGIQVHGGMGFIEETGAAQHLRDARIHPIYEGTNGIQANDLMGRKVLRDGGEIAKAFIEEMRQAIGPLAEAGSDDLTAVRKTLEPSLDALEAATDWMVRTGQENIALAASSAVPYLNLFGNTTTGWLMARAGLAAAGRLAGSDGDVRFLEAKIRTARFFGDQILNRSPGLCATVTAGAAPALALEEDLF